MFLLSDTKNDGKLGFLEKTTRLLFLALVVAVSVFPDEHPGEEKSPGEFGETGDRKGEKRHLCEGLFLRPGRRMVAKNETPISFFDRLSRLFG